MILPGSPILYLIVVVGVFVCFAFKGSGSTARKEKKSIYDIYKEIGENTTEYIRYQNWLEKHQ